MTNLAYSTSSAGKILGASTPRLSTQGIRWNKLSDSGCVDGPPTVAAVSLEEGGDRAILWFAKWVFFDIAISLQQQCSSRYILRNERYLCTLYDIPPAFSPFSEQCSVNTPRSKWHNEYKRGNRAGASHLSLWDTALASSPKTRSDYCTY